MMDKKIFIFPAIFLVILLFLFVIPISAFLTSEVLGGETAKSAWCFAYAVLKDHGSLIAGIMALIAAGMAIYFQGRSLERQIKSNKDLEYSKVRMQKLEELLLLLSHLKIKMEAIRDKMVSGKLSHDKESVEIEVRDEFLSMRAIAVLYNFPQKNEIYVLSILSEILVYAGQYSDLAFEITDENDNDEGKLLELKSNIFCIVPALYDSNEFIAVKDKYFCGIKRIIQGSLGHFNLPGNNGLIAARSLENTVLTILSNTRPKIYADLIGAAE